MTPRTRTLLAAVAAAALLAGCGGDGGPTVREPTGKFTVTLDDYLIRPQTIHVPKGELTVTVTNHGLLGHTFRIRSANHDVLKFTTIKPGETRPPRTFKLAPGRYTMYCALSNHEELGMHGTLVVG
jgi:plastocyanin